MKFPMDHIIHTHAGDRVRCRDCGCDRHRCDDVVFEKWINRSNGGLPDLDSEPDFAVGIPRAAATAFAHAIIARYGGA